MDEEYQKKLNELNRELNKMIGMRYNLECIMDYIYEMKNIIHGNYNDEYVIALNHAENLYELLDREVDFIEDSIFSLRLDLRKSFKS